MIHGEEPACSVRVEYPMSPALRQTKLGLKGPAVCAVIDQLCGIVLSRRCYHFHTDPKKRLLLPPAELLQIHGGPALQVHGQTIGGIQRTRTVGVRFRTNYRSPEVAHTIRQRRTEIRGTPQQVEGVGVVEYRNVNRCLGTREWERIIEEKIASGVCVIQRNRIRVFGSDEVCAVPSLERSLEGMRNKQ